MNWKLFWIMSTAFILRLVGIGRNLYGDEGFSIFFSSHSLLEIWKVNLFDLHPPLYYYFLHFFTIINSNIIFLRLSSVFLGLLSVYLVFLIAKKLFDERTGLLSALFLAINPLHILMSQELRMYVMVCVLLCAAFYFLLQEKYGWFTFFAILSLYTDNFAVFPVAIMFLYFLFKKGFSQRFFYSAAVFCIFIIPFFVLMHFQMMANVIISHSNPIWWLFILPFVFATMLVGSDIPPYFLDSYPVLNGWFVMLLISLLFFALLFLAAFRKKRVKVLSAFVFLPVLLPFLMNVVGFALPLNSKRFLFSLAILCIILAAGFLKLRRYWKFLIPTALIVCFIPLWFLGNFDFEDYKGSIAYITGNEQPGDIILISLPMNEYAFTYYYKGNSPVYIIPEKINWTDVNWRSKIELNKQNVKNADKYAVSAKRIWYFENREYSGTLFTHLNENYKLIDKKDFNQINIYLFEGGKR